MVNTLKQLVEDVVEIRQPIILSAKSAYWGWCFHMKTPLENFAEGSRILIDVCEDPSFDGSSLPSTNIPQVNPSSKGSNGIALTAAALSDVRVSFPIVLSSIGSGTTTLPMKVSDVVDKNNLAPSSDNTDFAHVTSLNIDISIHRKIDRIPLRKLLVF